MAKNKSALKIKLASADGKGHYYTTTKNKKNNPDKLKLRKYNKVLRKHVVFEETKLPGSG